MRSHPFKPLIVNNTKKLLIGTLPPENVSFYFSNSTNTRLWDILRSIEEKTDYVQQGSNGMSKDEKIKILEKLNIGIADIIYKYDREEETTKDQHIIPKEYNDLLNLAIDNNIGEFLFVYKNAYKWFLHSLENIEPVKIRKLKCKLINGLQKEIAFKGKTIKCIILPSPLNRGMKGESLDFKLRFYKEYIYN